MYVFGKNICSP